jgi:predicted nucleic acid-binding protein
VIVVDVNVIAYLLITGDKTSLAQETRQCDPQWLVPPLWRHEMLNILATYVRNGGASADDAVAIFRQAVVRFGDQEQQPQMEQALLLAAAHQMSAYDAQCVELAIAHKLLLISEDRTLQRKFPDIVRSMQAFCAAAGGGL